MGDLVLAAEGCHDAAIAYGAPFISGKDSFYNQAKDADGKEYLIPLSLLISPPPRWKDIRGITMNFKEAGNPLPGGVAPRLGRLGDMMVAGNNYIAPLDMKAAVGFTAN